MGTQFGRLRAARRAELQARPLLLLLCLALFFCAPAESFAQPADYEAQRARALQLYNENKFIEALPLLEKLSAAKPSDVLVLSRYGYAVYASTATISDAEQKKQTRQRALKLLLRARELGDESELTRAAIEALSANEGGNFDYSAKKEADTAMREGEAAFVKGDFAAALAAYDRALKADPKLYEAALFKGDVYYKSEQPAKAGEWFAQAIKINPNRETAYRYWGDSLMKEGKMSEARDMFVEAFITEPYNRLARGGLGEWAQKNNVELAHPDIQVPASVTSPKPGQINVTVDEKTVGNKDDGSSAWAVYGLGRAAWMDNKNGRSQRFDKAYPDEKTYRHSLAEELDALRLVITVLNENKEPGKSLSPSLATLVKLNNDGLLESYILLARADEGIAQDYEKYLKSNRDKLRRYVVEYILTGGGK
ncbi:MAG TPA: tetratricopeptide repeat protein [Pyrinomonadaceae bacterium]|jgi:tetratricopeptide (TPR) repeat protein